MTEDQKAATQPKASNEDRALTIVNDSLDAYKPEFTRLLGQSVDPEVFMSVAYEAMRTNPDLLEIALHAPDSLMKALHEAASLKLVPNGVLGSAYIVPRKNKYTGRREAHFQVGYRGLVELTLRSGQVSNVQSRVVYANEAFRVIYGTTPSIEHEPILDGSDRGQVRGFYAVAKMRDGSVVMDYMTVDQVNVIRDRSPSKTGPWSTDYEEMGRKTVVRRLAKSLPMSVEVQRAIELDDNAEGNTETITATVEPTAQATSLAGRVRALTGATAKAEPKDVTPDDAQQAGADAEPPAKAKTRKRSPKAADADTGPQDTPDEQAADDVPDEVTIDEPKKRPALVSEASPGREMTTWSGIVEPNPSGGAKFAPEDAPWKGKLVAPDGDDEGQIASFIAGIDRSYNIAISGLLELVPWERDGKAMPPYRKIVAYVVEVGEPV